MGKRSNFAKKDRDLYKTPLKAVLPLIPWLRFAGIRTFAEPCAGEGDLVRHLESHGLKCVYAGDIAPAFAGASCRDALTLTAADINGAAVITNPPFSEESQPLLKRMILHFQQIAPEVWLLLPMDFAANKWFEPFLPACSDIVAARRVRWFAGTKRNSTDNFAWYRFDARHSAGPIFHGRDAVPSAVRAASCKRCGRSYPARRVTSRFCSDACRQYAHRNPDSVTSA